MIISIYSDKNLYDRIKKEFLKYKIEYSHSRLRARDIFVFINYNDSFLNFLYKTYPEINIINENNEFKLSSIDLFNNMNMKISDLNINFKKDFLVIAGPCTIENDGSLDIISNNLKENSLNFIRGGAFKPRKSPFTFQGMGFPGLELLKQKSNGLKIVTELMSINELDELYEYTDIIQIGARNMDNFSLLKELGKIDKPILLKRGISSTIDEFLLAADYILAGGNENVILCERGIRTFEKRYRYTLDLSAVSILKKLSYLPVIVDPSHALGDRTFVSDLALASLAVGADGLLVEIHSNPTCAICDGEQSLYLEQFNELMLKLRKLAVVLERNII